MRSKARILVSAVALWAVLCTCSELAAGAAERVVTLLYTNDIESVYEPVEAFGNPEIELIGGIDLVLVEAHAVRASFRMTEYPTSSRLSPVIH